MEPDDRHIMNMYTAASEKNLAPVVYIVVGIAGFLIFGWLVWTVMGLAKKSRCFRQCFCPFWPHHHTLRTVEDGLQDSLVKVEAEGKEEEKEDKDETNDEEKEKKEEVNGDEKRRQQQAGQVKMLLEMINGDTMTTVTEI